PLYSQKYFSCPTTPPQPFSCHPSTLTLFFLLPSLFQKNSPLLTLQTKIFLPPAIFAKNFFADFIHLHLP
ncbi:hypothetical protein, partial [Chlamydia suis]|uniref:hypothetical protein n=1 Tax=Chlamydia suis TaxID=83559 RepID=UPI001C5BA72E